MSEGIYVNIPQRYLHTIFVGKLWDQPRCPSTDEWIKKM
jgi:hypothetical protein